MPVARGKKHTYVITDLSYGRPGEVIVSMDRCITKAIDKSPEEMMKSIRNAGGEPPFKG